MRLRKPTAFLILIIILLGDTVKSQGCTEDCIKCSSLNQCQQCRNNYDISGGTCVQLVDIYCTKIGSTRTSCSACASGYYILNNRCRICSVPGCKTCNTDPNKCDVCYEGQFRTIESSGNVNCNSKCQVTNCSECQTDITKCQNCLPGFRLSSDKTTCTACNTANCSGCPVSETICTACNKDYFLDGNGCTLCPYGCESCPNLSSCNFCDESFNFFMKSDNKCYLRSDSTIISPTLLLVLISLLSLIY